MSIHRAAGFQVTFEKMHRVYPGYARYVNLYAFEYAADLLLVDG
jgi:hypothetical protein